MLTILTTMLVLAAVIAVSVGLERVIRAAYPIK